MEANRLVQHVVEAICATTDPVSVKNERLSAFEGMLRDAASLAYDLAGEMRRDPLADKQAEDFYTRGWASLGCAADYVQRCHYR